MNKLILIFFLSGILILIACTTRQQSAKWIASTENIRWVEQQISISNTAPEIPVQIEVLKREKQQIIDGFGGCFNEMGWDALQILSSDKREEILQDIFDPENGCKFNICRMPIGANDYAKEWYSLNDTPGDYEMKHFNIERDKKYLIPYIHTAQKYRPDLKIWASPWCPPAWMKKNQHYACKKSPNNDYQGEDGVADGPNQLFEDEKTLRAYTRYFSKFLTAYQEVGIPIYAIHVQNEPNSCQDFPSCLWRPSLLRDFIKNYLVPQFQADHPKTEIWLGTIERPYIANIDTVLMDSVCFKNITGVGFQWAGKGAIQETHQKYPDKKLMQTETECGDGSNNRDAAAYTFSLMKHYFNAGANAYMYWNMILDETGKSHWGWKQNSMVSIDRATKMITYNMEFHLMKHFSHFIQPGARKLKVSDENQDVLAFLNPNGQVVTIIANQSENIQKINIKIDQQFIQADLAAKSFNTFIL